MSKKFKIIIPCDEANHVCDKTQYKEAGLWEKIKLSIHLIYCKACKKYTKNNKKLTRIVNQSKIECMDDTYKKNMKARFNKALKNQ